MSAKTDKHLETCRNNNIKHLRQLIGKTVSSLVVDNQDAWDPVYGIAFHDGTIAWILCDPEGNGPGHLDIIKSKVKA